MTHGPATAATTTTSTETARKRIINQNYEIEDDEPEMPIPPDGGWGWVVVFASFAIHIVTDGITYSFGIFYLEFLNYFGEEKGYTAWIASILVGVTLCSGPVSSAFVNRFGCRAVTIAGAILGGLCLLISCFAQNVLTLIFTIGLGAGFGFGLIYLPAIVSVTMYFEKYRSLATGIAVCGSGLGTFIFAPLTEKLIDNYGWRGAMLIISGIVFNCMLFGGMFRPLEPIKKKKRKIHSHSEQETPLKNSQMNAKKQLLPATSDNKLSIPNGSDAPIQRSASIGQEMTGKKNGNNGNIGKTSDNNDIIRMASSQPLLSSVEAEKSLKTSQKLSASGTMYRPDIFYQGSLLNIPQFKSYGELSISRSDRYGSLRRDIGHTSHVEDVEICGCVPCSRETKDTLTEMVNLEILKSPIFIIFIISNFSTSIGFNVPYVFVAAYAEENGIEDSSYLLAIIGIANTVGRIVLGYLSDKPWVNRLMVYIVCLTICGVATALSVLCIDFYSMAIYSSVFGFTIGAYVGLTSVILVDLLGLDKLTNAFGILLLFQGIASLVGPPFAGFLYDITKSYTPAFLMAGITIAISGLVLFAIPPMQKYFARKDNQRVQETGTLGFAL